jgi:blocked early in transport 1
MIPSAQPMRQRNTGGATTSSTTVTASATAATSASSSYMNRNAYRQVNPSNLEAGRHSNSTTNTDILEQQNNDRILELSEQVARLKGLTIDIGNEVKEQNSLLDNMGDGFSGVSNLLGNSLKNIATMLQSGGAKHMCYMVIFVVAVMVFLYWVRVSDTQLSIYPYQLRCY